VLAVPKSIPKSFVPNISGISLSTADSNWHVCVFYKESCPTLYTLNFHKVHSFMHNEKTHSGVNDS